MQLVRSSELAVLDTKSKTSPTSYSPGQNQTTSASPRCPLNSPDLHYKSLTIVRWKGAWAAPPRFWLVNSTHLRIESGLELVATLIYDASKLL
jgi:hypothetical protein